MRSDKLIEFMILEKGQAWFMTFASNGFILQLRNLGPIAVLSA